MTTHGKPLLEGLRARLRKFRAANGGNVTVTFALALVPMVGMVGAAVDYSHANSVRTAMQAAADSTALMMAKNAASLTKAQLNAQGKKYFTALFTRPEATGLMIDFDYTINDGSKVTVNVSADVKTDFMGLMGFSKLKVAVDSQARWGNTRLRVALALDNTGSMNSDGKMDALKVAAKGLLTQLKSAAAKNEDVYVSIIPFSKDVNVGTKFNQNWIKWSGQSDTFDENTGSCSKGIAPKLPINQKNCTTVGGVWTPEKHNAWNGCVMDRDKDYDTKNTAPSPTVPATLFPAEQYGSCPVELMPLSYNWTELEKKISDMTANGMTNQTIGLQWAFQSLTSSPFTIPTKDKKYQYSEVIILLTDGLNTENRFGDSTSTMDNRTLQTCANIKAAGITIYAVQVNTGGDPTQTFLKTCASTPEKFVELKTANQMVATFGSIATALTKLRISE